MIINTTLDSFFLNSNKVYKKNSSNVKVSHNHSSDGMLMIARMIPLSLCIQSWTVNLHNSPSFCKISLSIQNTLNPTWKHTVDKSLQSEFAQLAVILQDFSFNSTWKHTVKTTQTSEFEQMAVIARFHFQSNTLHILLLSLAK